MVYTAAAASAQRRREHYDRNPLGLVLRAQLRSFRWEAGLHAYHATFCIIMTICAVSS